MNSGLELIAIFVVCLLAYLMIVLLIRKWLIKKHISCFLRSTFMAIFLAPGLLLYGEHAGIPLPAFAWISGASNVYNCIEKSLFCSLELNLYLVILPFIATWIFAYTMCNSPKECNAPKEK